MNHAYDIVVVGAGPAGLAAATAAAGAGRRVAVLDENPRVGGQIWRAGVQHVERNPSRDKVLRLFHASGARLFAGRQVVNAEPAGTLDAWVGPTQTLETFTCERIILATGARERFLPFPGWTNPGVFGVGGLQALVRGGYNIRGKRVVIAGTGPLLLAVAAHLKQDGAKIVLIAEQAPLSQLGSFGLELLSHPRKLLQGLKLQAELMGVPYRTGCWPVAALSGSALTAARMRNESKTWEEPCDLLATGFHLVPNTELAMLLGCKVGPRGVEVDSDQRSSVETVLCAGEPTGIAGLEAALMQGTVAGLAAAGKLTEASALHRRRDAETAFGLQMDRAFALRSELRSLAAPDTIVCRCEDVRFDQLPQQVAPGTGWTQAKLQTRCGMGPCQGRICGPALQTIFGWQNTSVRAPLFPIPIAAMCSAPLPLEDVTTTLAQETAR